MTKHKLDAGKFYGDVLRKRQSGGVILSEINHQQPRRIPNHAHELAFFSLLLSGGYSEQSGSKVTFYKPMTIMFHPPAFEHRDEIGEAGGRFFGIELQKVWLDRLRECTGVTQLSTQLFGGELVGLALRLYREHKEFDRCSPLAIEGLLLEMLALAGRAMLPRDEHAPAWLSRTRELLRAEFQNSLTIDEIAAAVGVDPLRLSRVFRRVEHQTISEYVRGLRVEYCCRRLLQPDAPLVSVALEAGFADQSHFTRTFKRATGLTPQTFRNLFAPRRVSCPVPFSVR